MKFKVGDYVEIIKSIKGNAGNRFIITDVRESKIEGRDGKVWCGETDTPSDNGSLELFKWCALDCLKLVVDDEPVEMSFDELMLDLTQKLTVK